MNSTKPFSFSEFFRASNLLRVLALLCLSDFFVSNQVCAETTNNAQAETNVKILSYQVLAERSHKTQLFTQGLEIHNGQFFESSGLYNKSFIVNYPQTESGSAWAKLSASYSHKQTLDGKYFAEGLSVWNDKIYLLTWKEQTLLVYNAKDFSYLDSFYYSGEGWGLTHDAQVLIRSDGSDKLFFHRPDDFKIVKIIQVTLNHQPIDELNELEYVDGYIYANIWQDNHILKIDPKTGIVVGTLDLSSLANSLQLANKESVLNGIAYDAEQKAFWITGKQWPKMYLLKIF